MYCRLLQWFVFCTNGNRVPVSFRHRGVYLCQLRAVRKGCLSDLREGSPYCQLFQTGTAGEHSFGKLCHTCRNFQFLQCFTNIERPALNRCHIIRNLNLFQFQALPERPAADFGHAVRQHDLPQLCQYRKGIATDLRHAVRHHNCGIGAGVCINENVIHLHQRIFCLPLLQPRRSVKRTVTNIFYRFRHVQFFQLCTVGKAISADRDQILGQRDFPQLGAV